MEEHRGAEALRSPRVDGMTRCGGGGAVCGGDGGGGGGGGGRVSGSDEGLYYLRRHGASYRSSFVHNFAPMMVAASVCGGLR